MYLDASSHIRPLSRSITLNVPGSTRGVVLIHGFGDSPYSMRDLAQTLFTAGYSVHVPRLPGHGSRIEDFSRSTLDDWRMAIRRSLAALSASVPSVAILGRSFGGVLAMLELAEHPTCARALITEATPYSVYGQYGLRFVLPILKIVRFTFQKPWVLPHEKISRMESGRYTAIPLTTLQQFFLGLRSLTPEKMRSITQPALIVHGRNDTIAHPSSAAYFAEHLGSQKKSVVMLDGESHSAAHLHSNPVFLAEVLRFLDDHLGAGD